MKLMSQMKPARLWCLRWIPIPISWSSICRGSLTRDGIDLIQSFRQVGVSVPVLILSARRSVDDIVKGFELGGDDYLAKPFALSELLARIRNLK